MVEKISKLYSPVDRGVTCILRVRYARGGSASKLPSPVAPAVLLPVPAMVLVLLLAPLVATVVAPVVSDVVLVISVPSVVLVSTVVLPLAMGPPMLLSTLLSALGLDTTTSPDDASTEGSLHTRKKFHELLNHSHMLSSHAHTHTHTHLDICGQLWKS